MSLPVSEFCYCTLDEYLDGHRHHCPQHKPCFDCEPEEDLSFLDDDGGDA